MLTVADYRQRMRTEPPPSTSSIGSENLQKLPFHGPKTVDAEFDDSLADISHFLALQIRQTITGSAGVSADELVRRKEKVLQEYNELVRCQDGLPLRPMMHRSMYDLCVSIYLGVLLNFPNEMLYLIGLGVILGVSSLKAFRSLAELHHIWRCHHASNVPVPTTKLASGAPKGRHLPGSSATSIRRLTSFLQDFRAWMNQVFGG